jgi:hypothetical protein
MTVQELVARFPEIPTTREGVLAELQKLLVRHETDPGGFAASLLPEDTAEREVRGPGCS